jgi:hypothetical protein
MELKRKAQAAQLAEENHQPRLSKRHQSMVPNASSNLFRVDGLVALITGGGTGKCRVATVNETPL